MIDTTLHVASFVALTVILVMTLAMALSRYDSGVIGGFALLFLAVAALAVLIEFDQYKLTRASVIFTVAIAVWLTRNWINFLRYQRRCQREREEVIEWRDGRIR